MSYLNFRRSRKTLDNRVDTCHLGIFDRGPSDHGLVTQDQCFLTPSYMNTEFINAEEMNAVILEHGKKFG